VLRSGVLRMSEAELRPIEGRLRSFVSRRVASAADVDDVIQEVFLRLSRGLSTLRDEDRLAPWLFSIARNVVTDHHRRRARELASDTDALEIEAAPEPEATPLEDELTECVARFVAQLPAEQREAITLVELEGMSQKDAAAKLGLSHSGMKSRVQRGRAELRRMFEHACAIELDARRKVIECEPRACGGCGPQGTSGQA